MSFAPSCMEGCVNNNNDNNNNNNNKIECKKKHIMELHTYFDKPTVKMFDYKVLDG